MAPLTIGIDIGGPAKGFHAVALADGRYHAHFASKDIAEIAQWSVHTMGATVIAIDAPCGWSTDGRCRPAERALMQQGIFCFATPTEAIAKEHPKKHYNWMLRGMELFDALRSTHPVRDPRAPGRTRYCFETFPHAITGHLQGGVASAKRKRTERRALLERLGIDLKELTNIDTVDAALCAYVAHLAATEAPLQAYGEMATGLIVVPFAPSGSV
jgi:predicted RNase H-like nuclease